MDNLEFSDLASLEKQLASIIHTMHVYGVSSRDPILLQLKEIEKQVHKMAMDRLISDLELLGGN